MKQKVQNTHINTNKSTQWNGPSVMKPNPEDCKNCSSKCVDCAQLLYTIQHRTVLISSPLTSREPSSLSCCLSEPFGGEGQFYPWTSYWVQAASSRHMLQTRTVPCANWMGLHNWFYIAKFWRFEVTMAEASAFNTTFTFSSSCTSNFFTNTIKWMKHNKNCPRQTQKNWCNYCKTRTFRKKIFASRVAKLNIHECLELPITITICIEYQHFRDMICNILGNM